MKTGGVTPKHMHGHELNKTQLHLRKSLWDIVNCQAKCTSGTLLELHDIEKQTSSNLPDVQAQPVTILEAP